VLDLILANGEVIDGTGRPRFRADVAIEIPPLEQPGRYTLKFDLVSEGIDWFEKCGSPTTTKTFIVRD